MAVSEEEKPTPISAHVSDPALAPFLKPDFDPADYLNATLPPLSLSTVSSRPLKSTSGAVSLADLSAQTHTLLSTLNAHATRLSAILTQLTDDILRSGGRLAYQVEVLRGETLGLTETLTDGLKDDIAKFLPNGISLGPQPAERVIEGTPAMNMTHHETVNNPSISEPEHITALRTLSTVRSRLESVIKVFGEAMQWTLPPSEVSLGASLISVSAPEPGSDNASREQKGKEFAAALRAEIADLIIGGADDGMDKAELRIQALRDLAVVWKGTAEEKARARFVEGLGRLAEEKQREVDRERERNEKSAAANNRSVPAVLQPLQKSGGFLDNLQRIRGGF